MNLRLNVYNSIKWILYLLPFSALGIKYGDFLISILFIPIITLNICILRSKRFNKYNLLVLFFIISAFFFSAYGKFPFATYAPSLIVFIVLSTPFVGIFEGINQNLIRSDIQKSFLILVFYCFMEFIISLFSVDMMFEIERVIGLDGSTTTYRGIRRLRGGFLEPSVLAIALNFYFFILSQLNLSSNSRNKLLFTCSLLIILTFSSIGIIGLFLNLSFFLLTKKKVKFNLSRFLLLLATLALVINKFWEQVFKSFEKILNIAIVLKTGNIEGSVGYRVSSLLIIPDFFQRSDIGQTLFGIGFSNYTEFIRSHYGLSIYSGFYDGSLGNVFSAVIISTGLIGFTFFIAFLYRISILASGYLTFFFSLLISYGFLSFGNIISPWIWALILITTIILRKPHKLKIS